MRRRTYNKKDFAWINLTPKQIQATIPELLKRKRERHKAIKAIPKKDRTFENTILAIERSDSDISDTLYSIHFLMEVSPKKAVREAANKAVSRFEQGVLDIEYDPQIYRAFQEYAEGRGKRDKLSEEDTLLFAHMARAYRRMGFQLDGKKRTHLKANRKKLTTLGNTFSKNINDWADHIMLTPKETNGLPELFLSGLKRDKKGNYLVSLAYPEYFPFLQNSTNEKKRRELINKQNRKGGKQNMQLLAQMVRLRDENAKLLGYPNHGAYVTETRMAKNPKTVMRFLHGLARKLKPGITKDLEELETLKRELLGTEARVEYYDYPGPTASRLAEESKKRNYDVSDEKVREYFPLEVVTQGMFKIYETLFGVQFQEQRGFPLWHKDATLYGVYDKKTKQILSYFFLDLYPREGKYGHAAAFGIRQGRVEMVRGREVYMPPVCGMVTNFPKPTKKNPSLLSHREVETYFHEFGHVMHDMLTEAKYASQSGMDVALDFAEAPSQMLENWTWDSRMLTLLSGHYKDPKKKLPKRLLQNMLAAKNHLVSIYVMRQLVMSMYDMDIHTKRVSNLAKHMSDLYKKYMGFPFPPGSIYPASWGHMVGYDAGYYGYMWSLVYAADMFTRFQREGLLNKSTGDAYRRKVLAPGSSREEQRLVEQFLGRKSNSKAFLKEIGLV